MLNLPVVQTAMRRKGLSAAAVARACGISRGAVSSWLNAGQAPRPRMLLKLSRLLELDYTQLVDAEPRRDPVVLVCGAPALGQLVELAEDAREKLLDQARTAWWSQAYVHAASAFSPARLGNPQSSPDYLGRLSREIRAELYVPAGEPLTAAHLLKLLRSLRVCLVPLLRPLAERVKDRVSVVYLPAEDACVATLSLSVPTAELAHWLAYAYAASLVLHKLPAPQAHAFAQALAAELAPRPPKRDRESVTLHSSLFGDEMPTPEAFVYRCEALLNCDVFEALRRFQRQEGGRNVAYVQRTLNVSLADAMGLSMALWRNARAQTPAQPLAA